MLFEMSGILPGYANLGKVEKIGPDIYKKITKAISDYTRKTGSAPSPEDVKSLHEYARSLSKKELEARARPRDTGKSDALTGDRPHPKSHIARC
jgi:hypothetical protein